MRFEVVETQLSCHSVGFHASSCLCQTGLSEWRRLDSLPLQTKWGWWDVSLSPRKKLTREQAQQGLLLGRVMSEGSFAQKPNARS
jgi:hypothetical protein